MKFQTKTGLIIFLIFALILISSCTQDQCGDGICQRQEEKKGSCPEDCKKTILGPGDYDFSLIHDGLTRRYLVHIPSTYKEATLLPLVLAFHGGGGNAEGSPEYFQLNSKSDEEGFIVAYPEGSGKKILGKTFASWNAGKCCPSKAGDNIDDVGFIKKVLDDLKNKSNIDSKKIYATGMSNGALITYRLACEMANTFAAIAPVGGHDSYDDCNPSRPVPVIHFHGTEDPCAFYDGGNCGGCFADILGKLTGMEVEAHPWECVSVPDYLEKWSEMNECSNEIEVTYKQGNAECITYNDCKDGADVTLCTIEGMGHTWPGRDTYSGESCARNPNGRFCTIWKNTVGPLTQDISANDMIWEFFEKHPMR